MKKNNNFTTILLVLVFLIGLSLLLYPTVSDYWNSLHQTRAITQYAEQVASLDNDRYQQILEQAEEYNRSLLGKENRFQLTEEEQAEYEQMLNVSNTEIISYIEIPEIGCTLPIYHGTDEAVLQVGVGHVAGSSLPIGGKGTHCVLSGHRGLPSAKLFTNLDQLKEGDTFLLRTLDETLTYEVDQIRIVLPQEVGDLAIVEDKDYCTLVTCTPYGINSHRLLVRGHRVANEDTANQIRVTADAMQIEPILIAPFMAVPMLLILLIVLLIDTRRKKH